MNNNAKGPAYILCLFIGAIIGMLLLHWIEPDCPTVSPYIEQVNARTAERDALQRQLDSITAVMVPVQPDPDTITVIVMRKAKLQRAKGLESSWEILMTDPQ